MHKEKAPEDRGQVITESNSAIVAEPSAIDKQFTTLRAHAALAGWRLDRSGRFYILHKWGRAIDCADLDAARAALLRVGVAV